MFSDNRKISVKQFQRLLILDWVGKAGLFLPRLSEQSDGREVVLSLLLSGAFSMLYAWIIGRLAGYMEGGFYGYITERLGRVNAWLLTFLYLIYAFLNTVFLVRLFTAVAAEFMLPESPQWILMGMVLLAGMAVAWGGFEVRARVGEVLFRWVLYPLLFLLLLAAFSIHSEYLAAGQVKISLPVAKHAMQLFLPFGGMGIFLYIVPYLNQKEKTGAALYRAAAVTIGVLLTATLLVIGSFGEAGMRALPWPAITLMSSVEVPGRFLQRWDVIFTGLLLTSFFLSVGTGLFYLNLLIGALFCREQRWTLPTLTVLVLFGACWCKNYEVASRVFLVVNGYLLIPLTVMFSLFLLILEYVNRKKGKG